MSLISNLQYTIVVNILLKVTWDKSLAYYGIQHALVSFFAAAKALQLVMVIITYILGAIAQEYIFNIIITEVLFRC